jgi:regulator of RNase E activity RraA
MATSWNDAGELFSMARRELFTAVVGDVMDKLGLRHQFLPPYIQALDPSMTVVGRAMTVLEADCFDEQSGGHHPLGSKPFGLMFEALDDLKPDEIYVCTGGSPRYALWGELMSTRALKLGAVGAVLDGYSRDTRGVLALGFPTFSRGRYAQDQGPRGKVVDYRVGIEIGGVRVDPGDLIFGDIDGVCVVPRHAEQEVMGAALEKVRKENLVRKALEQGMGSREAFEKFGVM